MMAAQAGGIGRARLGARSLAARHGLVIALAWLTVSCAPDTSDDPGTSAPVLSESGVIARDRWVADIDTLRVRVAALAASGRALASGPHTPDVISQAHQRFASARLAFKHIEYLAAYYEPTTTKAMNGPALPRVDDEEGPEAVSPPEGFQVIEELLFPAPASDIGERVVSEAVNLQAYVTRLRTTASRQPITDEHLWDAARLEIARIVTLGITGLDSPIAGRALPEAAAALDGVRHGISAYATVLGASRAQRLDAAFVHAMQMVDTASSFDAFDRLTFITDAANPLARLLVQTRNSASIGVPQERRGFRMQAATIFDTDAFDVTAFGAPGLTPATAAQVELGHDLFVDPKLSGTGTVACATCHVPSKAFTDGAAHARGQAGESVPRNTPSVINVGLQIGAFSDLRTTYLEDQVTDVVRNRAEMHSSVEGAARTLALNATYRSRFATAFPAERDTGVTGAKLRTALAAYQRSLIALNSRVDQALRGETATLTAEERAGLNLFMGRARCATCHFAPLFHGTVPPMYQETEVEVLGVLADPRARRRRVDPDSGRFRITHSQPHLFAFRTPTVRNVALTAPYMHNGAYRTLDEVVAFYNHGGARGIGLRLENQSLPADSLGLSKTEQRALVRFMEALTDTAGLASTPRQIASGDRPNP